MIQLCMDFLDGRRQCVKVNATTSDYITSSVGVPQGTILGPLFWLAFINSYKPNDVVITLYADDVTCSNPIATSCDSKISD